MAVNNDYVVAIYDAAGGPFAGLHPTWRSCVYIPSKDPVVVTPVVTDLGGGLYAVKQNAESGTHIAGMLDFGVNAYPRYVAYDSISDPAAAGRPYVSFTVGGDTVNPVIYSVVAPRRTQVKVTFSEPVVMTTDANGALRVSNYEVPGLTIKGAARVSDAVVLLTTSAQQPGTTYNLTVSNVEDLSGNPVGA